MDENNHQVPQWDLHSKTKDYAKYIRNPTKVEKDSGLYFPRLTLYSRRFQKEPSIKIEFSVPKLIYRNNLQELSDEQFNDVVKALQDRLARLGVRIFSKDLISAEVTTIHFSKNFLLQDGYTSTGIISELHKIDLRKSFDFARARYINDGQSLCAHTKAHELVVYDKIADLKKNEKRAIDREQTAYQTSLFESLKEKKTITEILRIEVRLCQKQKLNGVLKKLGFESNMAFKQIFSNKLSQTILRHYWDSIIKANNLPLFTIALSPKDTLKELCRGSPNIKPKQAIYLTGLLMLGKDGNGARELRQILSSHSKDRTWYRIKEDYQFLSETMTQGQVRDWVKQIDQQIKEYKPIKEIV